MSRKDLTGCHCVYCGKTGNLKEYDLGDFYLISHRFCQIMCHDIPYLLIGALLFGGLIIGEVSNSKIGAYVAGAMIISIMPMLVLYSKIAEKILNKEK